MAINFIGLAAVGLTLALGAEMALAEMVVVVSAKSPVSALSKNQVLDIFLGKTGSFPDGSRAVPVDRGEDSAIRKEFYMEFAHKSPAQIKAYWTGIIFTGRGQPPREIAGGAEVKKFLVDNPSAISYIDKDLLDGSVKALLIRQ
jgi:ABC-type phosphate transport system substrate-binding protein